jgi:hypothetical protein
MNETMSESQLLWQVADKAEQCAAHDTALAMLLRQRQQQFPSASSASSTHASCRTAAQTSARGLITRPIIRY